MPTIYVVDPSGPSEINGENISLEAGFYYIELGIQGTIGIPVWPENQQEQFRLHEPQTNIPPIVDAGPNQSIVGATPVVVTLNGSATDDLFPVPNTYLWTLVSGPAAVTFVDDTDPLTDVAFTVSGTYILRLTADDTDATDSADVTIVVIVARWQKLLFA
jgi:hypothetical protein